MVIARSELKELVESGDLKIGDFDPRLLEPASYDMRLGDQVFHVSSQGAGMVDMLHRRMLVIGASEFALVGTHETLELPNDVVGHFGLKSSLSRRGLYASIGTQIDPGFNGRLFVSLFNLTPSPIAMSYLDTFLTVEFVRLDHAVDTGYSGPNQGKRYLEAVDVNPFLNVRVPSLAVIHREFGEMTDNLRAVAGVAGKVDHLAASFENLMTLWKEQSEQMSRHVTTIVEALTSRAAAATTEPTSWSTRDITLEQAMAEILTLFRDRGRLFYSDVIQELRLDLATVMEACRELERQGLIHGDDEAGSRE